VDKVARGIAGGQAAAGAKAASAGTPTGQVVGSLVESILAEARTRHLGETPIPSREHAGELVELVRQVVFPGFFGKRGLSARSLPSHVAALVARIRAVVEDQSRAALRYATDLPVPAGGTPCLEDAAECDRRAVEIAERFVSRLPELRRLLALDAQAAYDGDPAAVHIDETIFCYPGVDAILSHRVAHELHTMGVPLVPRIISELAHSRTGIDIHPGAQIGESFFIDHGGGVVIGETAVIGKNVRIYQGVTLGARSFEKDAHGRLIKGKRRHPTIGDRVTIYAGAVILGGDTVVGDDCVVGGSVFVTQSVPAGHMVRAKQPELVVRQHKDAGEGEWVEDWVI
jgi:serine O-acetyltransferase